MFLMGIKDSIKKKMLKNPLNHYAHSKLEGEKFLVRLNVDIQLLESRGYLVLLD